MTRQAILVLGMHRSGTSAVTGLLVHLGVEGPRTLMAANEHNQRGYWESSPLCEFHDRLLRAAGTEWDLWTRVAVEALDFETVTKFDREFEVLLEREFNSAPLFVMKDPRVCRLVGFWLRNLSAADIAAGAILTVRSPLEVARSLAARDRLGLEQALLLWLRHVLDAEYATRGIKRSVVRYQDLLLDWTGVAGRIYEDIGLDWRAPSPDARLRIANFLKADVRHHEIGIESLDVAPVLNQWIRQTYAALEQLCDPDAVHAAGPLRLLDQVREAFDEEVSVFGPTLEDERRLRRQQATQFDAERLRYSDDAEKELGNLRRFIHAVDTDRDELRRHAQALEKDRDGLRQHASALEKDRDDLRQYTSGVELELRGGMERASDLEAHRDQLEHRLGDLSSELEVLSGRLVASAQRIRALEQSRSWRWTAPIREALRVLQNIGGRRAS